MTSWFEDPKQLVRVDKVQNFGRQRHNLQQTVLTHSSFYHLCNVYNIPHKT